MIDIFFNEAYIETNENIINLQQENNQIQRVIDLLDIKESSA